MLLPAKRQTDHDPEDQLHHAHLRPGPDLHHGHLFADQTQIQGAQSCSVPRAVHDSHKCAFYYRTVNLSSVTLFSLISHPVFNKLGFIRILKSRYHLTQNYYQICSKRKLISRFILV